MFERFLTFGDGPTDAIMVDNAEWLDGLEYMPFLRDVGRHFTINRMLTFDSVKLRLDREQPLTFLEFNYMILQAYDFLELSRRAGVPAADGRVRPVGQYRQRHGACAGAIDGTEVYGVTTPLITTADGAKMGKTAPGAVWLNADAAMLAYDYWQFWRNTDDADVGRFLKLFTDLPLDEIAKLEALEGAAINDAKVGWRPRRPRCSTGETAAEAAEGDRGGRPSGGRLRRRLPTLALAAGYGRAALTGLGFTASNGEAKRKIAEGAVRLDGEWSATRRWRRPPRKLSLGKKKHGLLLP